MLGGHPNVCSRKIRVAFCFTSAHAPHLLIRLMIAHHFPSASWEALVEEYQKFAGTPKWACNVPHSISPLLPRLQHIPPRHFSCSGQPSIRPKASHWQADAPSLFTLDAVPARFSASSNPDVLRASGGPAPLPRARSNGRDFSAGSATVFGRPLSSPFGTGSQRSTAASDDYVREAGTIACNSDISSDDALFS